MQQVNAPIDIAAQAVPAGPIRRLYRAMKANSYTGPVVKSAAGFFIENVWAPEILRSRVTNVLESPDYARLSLVPNAGEITDGIMTLHNGIRVYADSYYGFNMRYVLSRTGGVHEPRQELIFDRVLETIPSESVMLELGSFWAFYSLWFKKQVSGARCVMVEPDPERKKSGEDNFELNNETGEFISAFVGGVNEMTDVGVPIVSIPRLLEMTGVDRLAVLHSDIQGAELEMLEGASAELEGNKVDYLFLSTHSDELHAECRSFVEGFKYRLVEDIAGSSSDSEDGLLIFQSELLEPLAVD